jgi:16S rRNA (adenine1518-N6/adenine1519-N6)-dimethyltransferase
VRKRFGQHFLEAAWVARLVDAVAPGPLDRIIEIGPGRGALTRMLAPRVAGLIGVEIDRDLAAALNASPPPHAEIVQGDFLETEVAALIRRLGDPPARVVGNLPYNVSSPILFKLLREADEGRALSDATLMLQREVADRLAAQPGIRAYGALAVQAARVADVELLFTLPPGAFRPPPKVVSAVVRLSFRTSLDADPGVYERLVRGVFLQRRKTLLRALAPVARTFERTAAELLERAGVDPRRRPEELAPSDFARLSRAVL